jgi:predicted permease
MRTLRCFFRRLLSLGKTRQNEERLRTEIEEHLRLQAEENSRAGLSPQEARRQAVLKFGAVEATREAWRDQSGLPPVESLIRDVRYAWRRLRMAPAFTIATVLTLALGIGATTSIFTLAHAVLLKSLPVANPDELYRLGIESRCCFYGGAFSQDNEFSIVPYELYGHLRDNTNGFVELAAFSAREFLFGVRRKGATEPAQSYPGEYVSGNYFSMFGIRPSAGRALSPADDRTGAPQAAMMSYRLWEQRYASDPSVIGTVFSLNDEPFTVVGVTPPGFYGDQLRDPPPDFFLPLHTADASDLNTPNLSWLDLIGRIRPGANPASIEAGMRVGLKQWLRSHWDEMSATDKAKFLGQTLYLRPGGAGIASMRKTYEHWLRILMMVSGFVLLIVCANVANLMLVRGMERRRETSLSMALGAQARNVVRQTLTESILLALVGGAAGVAIAFGGTLGILHIAFPPKPGLAAIPIEASPSTPVLLFALVTSLVTGLAFAIAPAWMATRTDPIEALRGAGRSTARSGSLPRRTLVVFQAAVSLVLLSASGLLIAALHRLENQQFGFAQDRVIVTADPRQAGYRAEQLTPLYHRIHDSLSAIPEVSSVALCTYSPMGNDNWSTLIRIDGRALPGDDSGSAWDRVTAGYFDVIGNPIVRGRGITSHDTATSLHVAVVNEAFARKFFGSEDPIGKHFGEFGPPVEQQYEVVGVARDARYFPFDLDKPVGPFFVLPEAQHDYFAGSARDERSEGSHFMRNIVIRLRPGARPPVAPIQKVLASLAPDMPILSIRTLKEQVSSQFIQQRLIARLTSLFGVLALLLASIGLYGVTAYNAGCRTGEIGVRMAVGARRGDIVALVLRGALTLIVLGLVIGLPLALAAGRFLGHQLYGTSPYDPLVMATAGFALLLAALAASFIPAFRASLMLPLKALRTE